MKKKLFFNFRIDARIVTDLTQLHDAAFSRHGARNLSPTSPHLLTSGEKFPTREEFPFARFAKINTFHPSLSVREHIFPDAKRLIQTYSWLVQRVLRFAFSFITRTSMDNFHVKNSKTL